MTESSVLVDAEYSDAIEEGKLCEQRDDERKRVYYKVCLVEFRIETCKKKSESRKKNTIKEIDVLFAYTIHVMHWIFFSKRLIIRATDTHVS